MKFLVCPQCGINRFYILNSEGERLIVQITRAYEMIPLDPSSNLKAYDTGTLYCLGCSWSGTKEQLVKYLI